MGLDAFVYCNCYKEGKTKPFPLPELEQFFSEDEEGYRGLHLQYDTHEESHRIVDEWMENACEHNHMDYISERIGNWASYRYFQQALADIGWSFFPTLHEELPNANGGFMTSDKTEIALQELTLFKQLANDRKMPFLIDTTTGEVVYNYVPAYRGVFQWTKPYLMGFDPQGFFIYKSIDESKTEAQKRHLDESQVVFRAMRFEQRFIENGDNDQKPLVEYFNADTEDRFVCHKPVIPWTLDANGQVISYKPRLLHVETRTVDAEEYRWQVGALERVCKASIETGNPVMWC